MLKMPARSLAGSILAAALLVLAAAAEPLRAAEEADIWPTLQRDIFGTRVAVETPDAVFLEAPYRAEDAALVPLTVRIPPAVAKDVKKLVLIIDKNPAPVVAEFTYGSAAGVGERLLTTRVRIDMYSNVRAVIEMADGKLLMATKFVKAAGGCSAPALKDADEALAEAGRMQVKLLGAAKPAAAGEAQQAQLMIRHPQYSGMQMNQLTGLYIPAKFVREIEVKRGADTVFRMEGGISISENPNIQFTVGGGNDPLEVVAKDTDGKTFSGRAEPKGS